jgi:hypothetical protein
MNLPESQWKAITLAYHDWLEAKRDLLIHQDQMEAAERRVVACLDALLGVIGRADRWAEAVTNAAQPEEDNA